MKGLLKRMSARERTLALTVGVLAMAALVVLIALQAINSLRTLDSDIADLEDQLLNYTQGVKEGENVDKAFQQISQEHSSAWSQVEIHERLRKEINRLSLSTLPPPGTDVATAGAAVGPHLVDILTLADGQLTESGKGYREYQIAFDVQPTTFQNLAIFFRRLQESPQALRIQAIDLKRQPDSTAVSAHVTVTRIVVDEVAQGTGKGAVASGAAVTVSTLRNAGFEQFDAGKNAFPEWLAQGCAVAQTKENVDEGAWAGRVQASAQDASLYQEQTLQAGKTYEITLSLVSQGAVTLGVKDLNSNAPYKGSESLDTKGQPEKARFRFTVEGTAGSIVKVAAPWVQLGSSGTVAYLDAVTLRQVGE